jgi:hypothetical protein
MKYTFGTKFLYDEDDPALVRRLAALFRKPLFRDAVLKPRTLKLSPTRENLAKLLVPTDDYYRNSDLDWVVQRQGKPTAGRLSIIRNPPSTSFTSFLELRFSLSSGYRGGPFGKVEEVRDTALACMAVGPSQIGTVDCADEGDDRSDAKFERFRAIDDMAVPVSIEWVNLYHEVIVANMAVDLRQAEEVPGVRVGRSGDYWWVVLCSEPLSFAGGVGVSALKQVGQKLGLTAIHRRFKRPSRYRRSRPS